MKVEARETLRKTGFFVWRGKGWVAWCAARASFSRSRYRHPEVQNRLMSKNCWGKIALPDLILVENLPGKHYNRSSGRPKAGRRSDFGAYPAEVQPKSGPEKTQEIWDLWVDVIIERAWDEVPLR